MALYSGLHIVYIRQKLIETLKFDFNRQCLFMPEDIENVLAKIHLSSTGHLGLL